MNERMNELSVTSLIPCSSPGDGPAQLYLAEEAEQVGNGTILLL